MEMAAHLQLRLHPAAAHALRPHAKRQPRMARRERHRQKSRRWLFGEFSHHRPACRDREDRLHPPARAPACAFAGKARPAQLCERHPAPTAHLGAMFVFYYILSKDGQRPCLSLRLFVHGVCRGFALRWIILGIGGAVGAFLAAWNLGLLRGDWYDRIKVILDHSYQPDKKVSSRHAVCSPLARAS